MLIFIDKNINIGTVLKNKKMKASEIKVKAEGYYAKHYTLKIITETTPIQNGAITFYKKNKFALFEIPELDLHQDVEVAIIKNHKKDVGGNPSGLIEIRIDPGQMFRFLIKSDGKVTQENLYDFVFHGKNLSEE